MNSKQNSTPQNRFFSRLSYQQKFILVTLVFILAFSGFIPLVSELFTRIQQYGYMELNGTRYLVPVQTLLVDIQIHQLTLHEFLDGDVPYSEVEVVQTRINDDLRALAEMQVQYGTELQVQNDYQIIQEKWNTLYTDARTLSDDESSALHQELAQLIQNLITHVGNTSFLILDPELDTYYLMDTVVLKQPQVQEQLNNLASSGALFIHAEVISENEKLLLLNLTSQLVSLNENMQKNLEIGLTYNTSGQMRTWVEAPLATAISANEAVISEIQSQLERETTTSEFEQNLHATIRAAQDANMELYRATSQALEQGIQGRITRYATRLATAASIALIAIFLAIVIGVGLMRAISRPLQNLVEAANRLAQGEYSARVPITSLDEAGKVAQTFNLMAQEVEASRTQLETRVAVRTRDLELAAEVGRNLTSIRDLNALLQEAVDTIRNRFE
ncbi:MAG TPA: HAMP domain-containing protein, partial [Anaerolineales bacterium]|nr:HAMP domain-containing protein [Anaerolineales bacterium]